MAEPFLPLSRCAVTPQATRLVVSGPGFAITHGQFCQRVAAWARTLMPQRRWGLYHDDPVEFAAALWGIWHSGGTAVLPADKQPATLQRLAGQVDGFVGQLPDPVPLAAPEAGPLLTEPLNDAAPCLVIATSGSTGDPTLVPKRLSQLAREVEALEACFGAAMGDATIHSTVSQQHIYGLLYRVLWPIAAGRPIHPPRFGEAMGYGRAVLIASPAYLKRLPAGLKSSFAAVFSSGGVLPAEASVAAEQAFGCEPFEIYGSTETGGVAWRQGQRPWKALPGVEWQVQDGLLAVRSPHLADANWLLTQDRVSVTPEGFALEGRADRIVKIEEKRVSLTAIEQRLAASPLVSESRALVLQGPRQVVAAVVVPSSAGAAMLQSGGKRALATTLGDALAEHFERLAIPRRWHFADALPTNSQGKTPDALLASLFSSRVPAPRWLTRAATEATLELDVTADLHVFDGHFPAAPILPGVAQIDWAVVLAGQVFALPARFVRLEALKFQKVVRPDCTLHLHLQWRAERRHLVFQFTSAEGVHSTGRITFEEAP